MKALMFLVFLLVLPLATSAALFGSKPLPATGRVLRRRSVFVPDSLELKESLIQLQLADRLYAPFGGEGQPQPVLYKIRGVAWKEMGLCRTVRLPASQKGAVLSLPFHKPRPVIGLDEKLPSLGSEVARILSPPSKQNAPGEASVIDAKVI